MFKSVSNFQSLINRDVNAKAGIRMVLIKALDKVLVSRELVAVFMITLLNEILWTVPCLEN